MHGDAGPGNFVHRDGKIVAVTDFEFCHLGDPAEDWGFCAAMRGRRDDGTRRLDPAYTEVLGFEMDEAGWRYWEAFNLFKEPVPTSPPLRVFADGSNPAPEHAPESAPRYHQVFLRRLVDLVD